MLQELVLIVIMAAMAVLNFMLTMSSPDLFDRPVTAFSFPENLVRAVYTDCNIHILSRSACSL
jgi:hypothetical protein